MRRKYLIGIVSVSLAAAICTTSVIADDDVEAYLNLNGSITVPSNISEVAEYKLAKLSLIDAANTISAQFTGNIVSIKLENVANNLIYAAEVLGTDGNITNILLDAGDGRVLARKIDTVDNNEYEGEDD